MSEWHTKQIQLWVHTSDIPKTRWFRLGDTKGLGKGYTYKCKQWGRGVVIPAANSRIQGEIMKWFTSNLTMSMCRLPRPTCHRTATTFTKQKLSNNWEKYVNNRFLIYAIYSPRWIKCVENIWKFRRPQTKQATINKVECIDIYQTLYIEIWNIPSQEHMEHSWKLSTLLRREFNSFLWARCKQIRN